MTPTLPPLSARADLLAARAAFLATYRDPVEIAALRADAAALRHQIVTRTAEALEVFCAGVRAERAVIDATARLAETRTATPPLFVREHVIPLSRATIWRRWAEDEGYLHRSA